MNGMPAPSGRLSEASAAKWHGGEDENNPRYLEPMRLAFETKAAEREYAAARLQRDAKYTRAVAAFASVITLVLGAILYAVGGIVATALLWPAWIGGAVFTAVGLVFYLLTYPVRASRDFLASVRNEENLKDKLHEASEKAQDKQRQLDEGVQIVKTENQA